MIFNSFDLLILKILKNYLNIFLNKIIIIKKFYSLLFFASTIPLTLSLTTNVQTRRMLGGELQG